jgi:hypothetical protein
MADKESPDKKEKTKAELKAEHELMMAKAAIKHAITVFSQKKYSKPPEELLAYWKELSSEDWKNHLEQFMIEIKKYKQVVVKKILFDIDHYIKDCKKLLPNFVRCKEEILLMIAIGQIKVEEFLEHLENLPSNREKLDRSIHKQIKELDWEDDVALFKLDELSKRLDQPRLKKDEMTKIENEIKQIEDQIAERKKKRDELAIKLVEWKARGNIDIASQDGKFRLDA